MDTFLLGVAVIVGVSCGGAALIEFAKAFGKRVAGGETKQVLKELRALREEMANLRGSEVAGGGGATKSSGAAASKDILSRLDRLQEDMTSLRDTTTKFDMSFDASLERLERRMDFIETRAAASSSVSASESGAPQMAGRS